MEVLIVGLAGYILLAVGHTMQHNSSIRVAFKYAFARLVTTIGYTTIVISILLSLIIVKILFQDILLNIFMIGQA